MPDRAVRNVPEIFRQPLVHPQQIAAHRHIVVGRRKARRAAKFSVPRMDVFMRQEPATGEVCVRIDEELRVISIVARLRMLQSEMPRVLRQGEQKIVMAVVMGAKQRLGLRDQIAVCLQLGVVQFEVRAIVGHEVQMHGNRGARRQIDPAEVLAADQRRIDQLFEREGRKRDAAAARGLLIERGPITPARRNPDARPERDVVRGVSGRVEQHLIPLEILDAAGDRCALPELAPRSR